MICIIDQACGQEIWILAIDHCIFMDRDEVKVNKNATKNKGDIQHHHQRSLVNKGFVIWPKSGLFLARPKQEILNRQDRPTNEIIKKTNKQTNKQKKDRPIFPARVANQNTGFALSCPHADSAIL